MHLNWNNAFSKGMASVAALVATTGLNAIPKDPCECPPPPVCCVEPAPGPFAFAYPYDMDLQCPRDFYIYGEGLMLQAKEDGLNFTIVDSSTPAAGAPITQGTVGGFSNDHSDWDYQPGFRVGMGFYMDHDAWNVDFQWTWVKITDYQNSNANTSSGGVLPIWLLGSDTPEGQIGQRSSAVWNASYDVFDIILGKPYHVSRYFVLNPFFGVRGGWIDQHYSVDYGGTGTTNRTIAHNNNDFWGVGTRAGVNTDWILGKGWCLFGNIAASMLYGKFQIDQSLTIPGESEDGYDIDYDFYQNVPNMEIVVGIGWGEYFDKKRYHVGLKAAYEFHQWFDQLNLRKFTSGGPEYTNDVVSRGNLTLNGFSLRLQFDM